MNPTLSDVHVDVPLTNISIAHIQSATSFVARSVFPEVPVGNKSDKYLTWLRAPMNRDTMKARAPGTESARGGFELDWSNGYSAEVYSLHQDIDDQVRANQTSPLNIDMGTTIYLSTQALINQEKKWATNYFSTGKWATEYAGVPSGPTGLQLLQWNNAGATPIEDIKKLKTAMMLASGGFEPNTLTVSQYVLDALLNHPEIIARLNAGQTPGGPAMADLVKLAQIFGIDRVLVMKAVENTAPEGGTESNAFIGGKNALLSYTPAQAGLMTPAAGYTFSWTGYLGGAASTRIKSFRMEHLASDRQEIEVAYDMKLTSSTLGVFINGAVA